MEKTSESLLSQFFTAEKTTDNGVALTLSSDLVDIAAKAAPFVGAILAASNAPFFFVVAAGGGFILAQQLKFFNSYIDDIWKQQSLAMQIVISVVVIVAIFLSPIVSGAFAGQRTGAWVRDNYQAWLQALSGDKK